VTSYTHAIYGVVFYMLQIMFYAFLLYTGLAAESKTYRRENLAFREFVFIALK